MERSAVHLLAKRGKSIREIAAEVSRSPTTIARILREPVDQQPAPRHRSSRLMLYRPQVEQWVREGVTAVRMLESARGDPEPLRGVGPTGSARAAARGGSVRRPDPLRRDARRVPAGGLGRDPAVPVYAASTLHPLLLVLSPQVQSLELGVLDQRYAAGNALPVDPRTGKVIEGGIEAAGASLTDLVKVTVHLKDAKDWPAMNEVYRGYFTEYLPARMAFEGNPPLDFLPDE